MKAWLSRVVANTVLRGEEGQNRVARWSRWLPWTPTVAADRFQGPDEPAPRHWREFPRPWRTIDPTDSAITARLRQALAELPDTWRAVVIKRDVGGEPPTAVSMDLGLAAEQQRAILHRARAYLRERLDRLQIH